MSKTKQWSPLDITTLKNGRWIGCDQSITNTGIVLIEIHEGICYVLDSKVLQTKSTEYKGWEDTFTRAEDIELQMQNTIRDWVHDYDSSMIEAYHEAPPAGGGVLVRTESSILTAYAFRKVVSGYNMIPKMAYPRAHKNLLCGVANADKKTHHAEVKKLLPDILDSQTITNEAKRDALSIALFGAWESTNGS